jgi:hypothetical protein
MADVGIAVHKNQLHICRPTDGASTSLVMRGMSVVTSSDVLAPATPFGKVSKKLRSGWSRRSGPRPVG